MRPLDFEREPTLESGEVAVVMTKDDMSNVVDALTIAEKALRLSYTSEAVEQRVEMDILLNQITSSDLEYQA